jgi:hypothetical protein
MKPSKDVVLKTINLSTGDPSKMTLVGSELPQKWELALIAFLQENRDILAWKPSDMPGVPRSLIEHKLNVDPTAKPKK